MTDLVIRPLVAGEESLFTSLPDAGLAGPAAAGVRYAGYRPEWSWVALRDGVVVARAAWWGGPDDTEPIALDWFDFTDPAAAVALLRAAPLRAEYSIKVRPDWRDVPAVRAAVESRIAAAEAAGMTQLVERHLYRWTPECGLPPLPNRLVYRPDPDDAAVLAAFRRIHRGSLDAHTRRTVAAAPTPEAGIEAAAREDLEILRWLPSPRAWWLLAHTPDGELVGLVAPGRNHSNPVVAYVGVVPEQRGHGYAYDLLVAGTHALVERGADRIVAGTDVTNTPMAAAFARAGYPVELHRIDLV